jgi:Zn-finger nucleic acid-binding protein
MTPEAGSLRCPSCGATVDPDAGRCPYCRGRLATVSCPSCFALMFQGAAYCPKCGAARTRAAAEEADGAAKCPGCRNELQRIDVGSTAMLECPACDGIWVDADVFERLCADRAAQAAVLPRLSTRTDARGAGRVRYRPCARCGKMMNRVNFGKISGAVVDVCRGHGTFLDAGELHQIVTFIQDGGLERARRAKLEELRDEERKLADRERTIARERTRSGNAAEMPSSAGSDLVLLIDLITGH